MTTMTSAPFTCPVCQGGFRSLSGATRHMLRQHPEMPRTQYLAWRARLPGYTCAYCGGPTKEYRARYCSIACRRRASRPLRQILQRRAGALEPGNVHPIRLPGLKRPVPAMIINVLTDEHGRRRYPVVPLREPRRLIVVTDEAFVWDDR